MDRIVPRVIGNVIMIAKIVTRMVKIVNRMVRISTRMVCDHILDGG